MGVIDDLEFYPLLNYKNRSFHQKLAETPIYAILLD